MPTWVFTIKKAATRHCYQCWQELAGCCRKKGKATGKFKNEPSKRHCHCLLQLSILCARVDSNHMLCIRESRLVWAISCQERFGPCGPKFVDVPSLNTGTCFGFLMHQSCLAWNQEGCITAKYCTSPVAKRKKCFEEIWRNGWRSWTSQWHSMTITMSMLSMIRITSHNHVWVVWTFVIFESFFRSGFVLGSRISAPAVFDAGILRSWVRLVGLHLVFQAKQQFCVTKCQNSQKSLT